MNSKILPARFYRDDPADLADELIAAREAEAAWEARCALRRAADASVRSVPAAAAAEKDCSHRYRGTVAKRARIQALVAAAMKGKS